MMMLNWPRRPVAHQLSMAWYKMCIICREYAREFNMLFKTTKFWFKVPAIYPEQAVALSSYDKYTFRQSLAQTSQHFRYVLYPI